MITRFIMVNHIIIYVNVKSLCQEYALKTNITFVYQIMYWVGQTVSFRLFSVTQYRIFDQLNLYDMREQIYPISFSW